MSDRLRDWVLDQVEGSFLRGWLAVTLVTSVPAVVIVLAVGFPLGLFDK